jgi:hypothetical protein
MTRGGRAHASDVARRAGIDKGGASCIFYEIHVGIKIVDTVRLTSIDHPQIEGKFTATPGGLTNVFYGCID